MNKNFSYLIILILVLIGCTEIGVIEEDIPFEEKIVVYGRLKGGTNEITISFSKSFPIDESLRREDTAIKDLVSYLWSESQGIYPLVYDSQNNYIPIENLIVNMETEYELHANIGSERIFARTIVPSEADVQEIEFIEDYITCKILPKANSVYGCKYNIIPLNYNFNKLVENTFFEISEKVENTSDVIQIRSSALPFEFLENVDGYILNLEVYSFDTDYHEYYYSRKNNKPIENIFSEGGGSVFWNVQGENVIGMFIGYSVIEFNNIGFE